MEKVRERKRSLPTSQHRQESVLLTHLSLPWFPASIAHCHYSVYLNQLLKEKVEFFFPENLVTNVKLT